MASSTKTDYFVVSQDGYTGEVSVCRIKTTPSQAVKTAKSKLRANYDSDYEIDVSEFEETGEIWVSIGCDCSEMIVDETIHFIPIETMEVTSMKDF